MSVARILCFDLGSRRVGIAVSDPLRITAQPLETIHFKRIPHLLKRIKELIAEYDPLIIVVGLPLTLQGTEGLAVRRTRHLLKQLASALKGREIVEWDERLTTMAAERVLIEGNLSREKRKNAIDSVAASLILQGYMGSIAPRY